MDKPLKNDIVRLKPPPGPGEYPEAMVVTKNGQRYALKYGADFRVSTSCDPDNRIASLDYKGDYPLVHLNFVKQHAKQFELIKRESDD